MIKITGCTVEEIVEFIDNLKCIYGYSNCDDFNSCYQCKLKYYKLEVNIVSGK